MLYKLVIFLIPIAVGMACKWMGYSRLTFPRWFSVILSALIGSAFAWFVFVTREPRSLGELSESATIALGAALGWIGGTIVWWLDRPRSTAGYASSPARAWVPLAFAGDGENPRPILVRFFTYMAFVFCWLPMFGLVIGICAVVANGGGLRRTRLPFRIALAVAAFMTVVFIVAIPMLPRR